MKSVNLELLNYVQPIYSKQDFEEFPTASSLAKELESDLVAYEKHACWTCEKHLIASKIREAVVESVNPPS